MVGKPSLIDKVRFARNPRLDHQTKPGLSGANGLIATILEPNAENRGAVCSQSRRSLPSADGQTQDARHEEQREQLAAPTILPGGIFYRRSPGGPAPKIALGSDSAILSPAQPGRARRPKKGVRRDIEVRHEPLAGLSPCATVETFLPVENSARASLPQRRDGHAVPQHISLREYERETVAPAHLDPDRSSQTARPQKQTDRCDARPRLVVSSA
jgi:hypothetical protein